MSAPIYGSLFSGVEGFGLGLDRAGFRCAWQVEIDAAANRVLEQHYPTVPRHRDIRAVRGGELEPVDAIIGGWPCFPRGTLILCRDGMKDIDEIRIGDIVLTHAGNWMPVTQAMRREAPLWSLRGHGHPAFLTTEEHPLWAAMTTGSGPRRHLGEPSWIPAREMLGKRWASPDRFPRSTAPEIELRSREVPPPPFTPAFFWLVGAYLGNGWLRRRRCADRPHSDEPNGVVLCIGKARGDALEARIAAAGVRATRTEERTTSRFVISSAPLGRWIREHFGEGAGCKGIPSWALGMGERFRRALFDGYAWTDGSRKDRGNGAVAIRATSISKRLILGVKLLAQSLGYSISLYFHQPHREAVIEGRRVSEQPTWSLCAEERARSSISRDGHRYGLVRHVSEVGVIGEVFNIEVAGDNSYIADGIAVHNCQGLSTAGRRRGLADPRSRLFFEFVRVVREMREATGGRYPEFILGENVPGALSSNGGRDWAVVFRELAGLGPLDIAWRVLDAQYLGVAQRRRRVFLVVDFGGERAGEVLALADGLSGHPPPRREAGEGVAADLTAGSRSGRDRPARGHPAPGRRREDDVNLVAFGAGDSRGGAGRHDFESEMFVIQDGADLEKKGQGGLGVMASETMYTLDTAGKHAVAHALRARHNASQREDSDTSIVAHALTAEGHDASEDGTGRGTPLVIAPFDLAQITSRENGSRVEEGLPAPTLHSGGGAHIALSVALRGREGGTAAELGDDVSTALRTGGGGGDKPHALAEGDRGVLAVRRLTPLECCRLQDLPDDWLDLDPPLSDSAKYRLLGNAVCAAVSTWLGKRLMAAMTSSRRES